MSVIDPPETALTSVNSSVSTTSEMTAIPPRTAMMLRMGFTGALSKEPHAVEHRSHHGEKRGCQAHECHGDVIDALGFEWIEHPGCQVASAEAAGMRVVVDACHQEPHRYQHDDIARCVAARHAAAAAMSVVQDGADQAGDRRRGAKRVSTSAKQRDGRQIRTRERAQREAADACRSE